MEINGVIGCDTQEVRTSTCSLFECVLTFFLERLLSFNTESLPVTIACNKRYHLQDKKTQDLSRARILASCSPQRR